MKLKRGNCRFQYQVQRYDKSSAKTSFGDLKSNFFLGADSSIKCKCNGMTKVMLVLHSGI